MLKYKMLEPLIGISIVNDASLSKNNLPSTEQHTNNTQKAPKSISLENYKFYHFSILLFSDIVYRANSDNYDSVAILPHYHHVVVDEAHHIESVAFSCLVDVSIFD